MIDAKYSLKYSFPHSVVHIIDNSYALESEPVSIADDPSLYGAIVVSAMPYGEDNKIISLTRSDVANVAFGMNSIGKSDIEKYGQTITYPASLLKQGAPVKMLRVTPSDATYAYTCVCVEWKREQEGDHYTIISKFSTSSEPISNLENYANPKRIYNALVSKYHKSATQTDPWNRRLFIAYISAGRGKNYNDLVCSIDAVSQSKRPANVCYTFSTIDAANNNNVIEQFSASLVNINQNLSTKIDEVNSVVSKRLKGSSVIIPFVNESAVQEVYAAWYEEMTNYVTTSKEVSNETKVIYKTVNVNTFDIIFGKYIYNGNTGTALPLYGISQEKGSLPILNEKTNVTSIDANSFGDTDTSSLYRPVPIEEILYYSGSPKGFTNNNNDAMFGSIWLTPTTEDVTRLPKISMVYGINQSSGNVSSIALNDSSINADVEGAVTIEYAINVTKIGVTNDALKVGDEVTFTTNIEETTKTFKISENAEAVIDDIATNQVFIVKMVDNGSFLMVKKTIAGTGTSQTITYTIADPYDLFKPLILNKYSAFIGYSVDNQKFYTTGYMYIENIGTEDAPKYTVGMNMYGANMATDGTVSHGDPNSSISSKGILIADTTDADLSEYCHIQTVPSTVSYTSMSGNTYDVKIYPSSTVECKGDITTLPTSDVANKDIYKVTAEAGITVPAEKSTSAAEFTAAKDSYIIAEVQTVGETTTTKWAPYTKGFVTSSTFDTIMNYSVISTIVGSGAEKTYTNTVSDSEPKFNMTVSPSGIINSLITVSSTTSTGTDRPLPEIDDYTNKKLTMYCVQDDGSLSETDTVTIVILGVSSTTNDPETIKRFVINGQIGSLYKIVYTSDVPKTYYSLINKIGINPSSKYASIVTKNGSTGFLDDAINTTEDMIRFKYKYAQLLVDAYRGRIDPSIKSPTRCPAKYLFDGGTNTIIGLEILPTATYQTSQLIENSTVFTEDEISSIMSVTSDEEFQTKFKLDTIGGDIDVKQAMFDLMEFRVYQGIPEDMRPLGPGSGLSLHLDSCMCDAEAVALMNSSFASRFNNPNCSWDIGGYTSSIDGITYTYVKNIVDNLIRHCKETTINTHYSDKYAVIANTDYSECFPDIDTIDWDIRETTYNFGGNTWIPDINGNIVRRSQRTMYMDYSTSDLVQESNMRTLSQLVFLLQNKIDGFLHEYNDDNVIKTLSDEVDNMFSTWNGSLVQNLSITFARDKNVDGGDIIVCNVSCTFRGIILRVPIIVDVTRRS